MANDIGLIGLAVMGENLVLNMERNGFKVAVYNRTASRTDAFLGGNARGKKIEGFKDLKAFVGSLAKPRRIMLMVKAGAAVDETVGQLLPLLDRGDLLVDGGNSLFKDTIRRSRELESKGFRYIGTGVSGGEEGALKGPAIMPGGTPDAYDLVKDVFLKISAKVRGEPCCTWIGADGAGHYVKMIHNGIEYGDMQLICESYFLMKELLGMSNGEMASVFDEWNAGELASYLIEITAAILKKKDPETGTHVVDLILDKAGQKGTGIWTSQNALDLGVSAPTIAEAVFARCLSAIRDQRVAASRILKGPALSPVRDPAQRTRVVQAVREALYASKICSYSQGFGLMKEAAREYKWSLDFGKIAMIWRGGCIIRAQFLERIKEAYERDPGLQNLMLDDYFRTALEKGQAGWREVVALAAGNGIPVPAFMSSLAYFDGYRSEKLPANMLQAQRDYFGAHTYERVDRPGAFHTEWIG
jgi:6-phosphogluconate dehydrogenase